ncbi:hypothetical protein G7092_28235 [Mucilaginibacter sp. HC2]|uniref:hypothetical protein n=1 Tax=Mucilaginibacter inviolabilis TaxID=2714892 RepID=UPI00140AF4D0|nr:hypothetical protein [Mucilaginibacter inviolabilis]NHA07722.1 hypothetical protein [Mucilaginibacter inviolabilis]
MFNLGYILHNRKKTFVLLLIGVFILFFWCSWTYKLDILPGLHGDEAWSGLKADHFIKHSFDQITGMNHYSGILQASLTQAVFSFFPMKVFYLRIGGALFNLLGLIIICSTLLRHKHYYSALAFLAIFSQSALYLTSPRVAWEVNTFTLFFLSLLLVSAINIYKNSPHRRFWVFILLLTNILGTYNHIIFSAVPISIFIGLCLWTLYGGDSSVKNLIIVFGISIGNIITLFFLMKFFQFPILLFIRFIPFVVGGVLIAEYWLLNKLSDISLKLPPPNYFQFSIKVLLLTSILLFFIFHGKAFFEVLTGYKIFLQNYSYESSFLFRALFIACAVVFIFYLFKYLWQDFQNSGSSLYAFLIITYLGVINLYTVKTSFRYYLVIYALVGIYMAFKLSVNVKGAIPLIITLVLSFGLMNTIQLEVFTSKETQIRAVNFRIGNGQIETSAHFLPKEPLLHFLRNNRVGYINYLNDNSYFLVLPIEFYKLNRSWKEDINNKISVDYDYVNYRNGYIYYLEH